MNEQTIFVEALSLDEEKQDEYLQEACEGNAELRSRVERLLAAHNSAGDFMNHPAALVAADDVPHDSAARDSAAAKSTVRATGGELLEQVGSSVGPYTLREQIGEGGMGTVFRAEQSSPIRREVALKIIKPGMDSRRVVARFEAERQTLALMDHLHIAKVLDAGTTSLGRPYFVMELVDGIAITDYCDQENLDVEQRLKLMIDVCRGIQHAHQKGIIHRDLKPSNVMVTLSDGKPVVKIIDFGIAKAIHEDLTDATILTLYAQVMGTPLYMSPEQAERSDLDIDTRSDVYSLGVLLYELLTGTTPFDADSLRQVGLDEFRRMVRETDPPRPSSRISTVRGADDSTHSDRVRRYNSRRVQVKLNNELDWIVMRSLEKDRDRRYPSALAFATDLEKYLSDEPVEACPPTLAYRLSKYTKRHKFILGSAALVSLALILGIAGTSWQAYSAMQQRDQKSRLASELSMALENAEAESQRATANLELAKQAVETVYRNTVGEDRLEQLENDWTYMPGDAQAAGATVTLLTSLALSEEDEELLNTTMHFYEKLSTENPTSDVALFESAQAHSRVAQLRFWLGQESDALIAVREAIRQLEILCDRQPNHAHYLLALGNAFYQQGQLSRWTLQAEDTFQESIEIADQVVTLEPEKVDGYRLRGKSLVSLNALSEALPDFKKSIELAPDNARFHSDLSRLHFRLNHLQPALVHAKRAVELEPQSALSNGFHQQLQDIYLHPTYFDFDLAAAVWQDAIPYATDEFEEYEIRARAALAENEFQEVLDLTQRWNEAGGESYQLYVLSAIAYQYLGDIEAARVQLAIAADQAEYNRDPGGAYREIADLYLSQYDRDRSLQMTKAALEHNPRDPFALSYQGRVLFEMHRYEDAIECLDDCIDLAPRLAEPYYLRAKCHYAMGDLRLALSDLEGVIEVDPTSAVALNLLRKFGLLHHPESEIGQASLAFVERVLSWHSSAIEEDPNNLLSRKVRSDARNLLGDFEGAIQDLQTVVDAEPDNTNHLLDLAICYEDSGRVDEALAVMDQAIELEPDNFFNWTTRGNIRLEAGNYEAALEDITKAIELAPGEPSMWSNRGVARMILGDSEGAIADFSESIRMIPLDGIDWVYRGMAKRDLGDFDGALEDLDHAVQLDPNDGFFLMSRAELKFMMADDDGAREDAEQAVNRNPRDAICWASLGTLLQEMDEPDRAIDCLETAIDIDPTMAELWSELAAVYRAKGDKERAKELMERAIELDPDSTSLRFSQFGASLQDLEFDSAVEELSDAVWSVFGGSSESDE